MDDVSPTPQDNRQASASWLVDSKRTRPDALVPLATRTLPTVRVGHSLVRTDLAPYSYPWIEGLRGHAALFSGYARYFFGSSQNLAPLESFTLPMATFGRTFCVAASTCMVVEAYPIPKNPPVSATAHPLGWFAHLPHT